MSTPSPNEATTPADGLSDHELSKRFYYGGMFGLPWLWIVHAIHFYGKQRNIDAQRLLREEQQLAGKDAILREICWFDSFRLANALFAQCAAYFRFILSYPEISTLIYFEERSIIQNAATTLLFFWPYTYQFMPICRFADLYSFFSLSNSQSLQINPQLNLIQILKQRKRSAYGWHVVGILQWSLLQFG